MGQKGNFLDVPQIARKRDERLGFGGDAQAFQERPLLIWMSITFVLVFKDVAAKKTRFCVRYLLWFLTYWARMQEAQQGGLM